MKLSHTHFLFLFSIAFGLLFSFSSPTPLSAASFTGSIVGCGNITVSNCKTQEQPPRDGKLITGECSFCDVMDVIQKILNFLVFAVMIVATLLFCYAGVLYLFSAPSMGNIEKAHKIFWNVAIGLVITLASWLIIDTVMKILYDDAGGSKIRQDYGPWNNILCPSRVQATCEANEAKKVLEFDLAFVEERAKVVTTGDFTRYSDKPPGSYADAYSATEQYDAQIKAIASKYNIDPDYVRAMMMVESRGNPNAASAANAHGLLQFTIPTAKDLDPSLRGATNDQIIAKLKDPAYNLQLTDKFLAQLAPKVGGNGVLLAAAWNGGAGALGRSADCPGQMKFECRIRPGGYVETQKHVERVSAAYDLIKLKKSGN